MHSAISSATSRRVFVGASAAIGVIRLSARRFGAD
jgi:hypothetical protein